MQFQHLTYFLILYYGTKLENLKIPCHFNKFSINYLITFSKYAVYYFIGRSLKFLIKEFESYFTLKHLFNPLKFKLFSLLLFFQIISIREVKFHTHTHTHTYI